MIYLQDIKNKFDLLGRNNLTVDNKMVGLCICFLGMIVGFIKLTGGVSATLQKHLFTIGHYHQSGVFSAKFDVYDKKPFLTVIRERYIIL